MEKKDRSREIAIIGMSCRFPGANDIDTFWLNLINGVESITTFSKKELLEHGIPLSDLQSDKYVRAKGYIENCDHFDADFFGYPPRDAMKMDPQIRLLHECSYEALERASYDLDRTDSKVGAFFGANENQAWLSMINNEIGPEPSEKYDTFILNFREYTATRVAHNLNLKGPALTVLTACSTSLVAVHLACESIRKGESDMALAGGASLTFPIKSGYDYRDGLMVSKDGHCKTFDKNADGTVFGDGVGVVLLKALDKAIEDKDHIHAVIKGSAINNDGNDKIGYTAPSQAGQEMVIREALSNAGVDPKTVGYLEAHGTATKIGDPIEANALVKSYGPTNPGFRKIGSVKTNIGHVNVAAGAAALIKAALSLEHEQIPPHLNFNSINPDIDYKTEHFTVNTVGSEFQRSEGPCRAGVSAFGFGGTNAHMILEAPPATKETGDSESEHLIAFSAKSASALKASQKRLLHYLKQHPKSNLKDLAFSLNLGRKQLKHRTHFIATSTEDAVAKLQKTLQSKVLESKKSVAFMFPGQGAQYVNMGKELYENEVVFREAVDECDEILKSLLPISLLELIYPSKNSAKSEERLTQTQFAQPAIFTVSYATAKLLAHWGVKPDVLIGHSVGEYVAACLSGVFSLEEALTLISKRSELIQAQPEGDMLAIAMAEEEVQSYLTEKVSLAAVNAPLLSVVSGEKSVLDDLQKSLKQNGIVTQSLKTSHPFHSHLMDPVLAEFEQAFTDTVTPKSPRIPIISTVTGKIILNGVLASANYWKKNIRQTVLFSQAVKNLIQEDSHVLLEVGPGTTLNGLIKMNQNGKSRPTVFSTLPNSMDHLANSHEFILNSLGGLWQNGVDLDWITISSKEAKRIPLPTYPFERQKFSPQINIEKKASSREAFQKNPDLKEWFYTPTWKRAIALQGVLKFKRKQNWLIFADGSPTTDSVIEELSRHKQRIFIIRKGQEFKRYSDFEYEVNPVRIKDYNLLFSHLERMQKMPDKVIHFWNFSDEQSDGQARYSGFFSLLYFAQTIGKHNYTRDLSLSVITNQAYQVLGNEKVNHQASELVGPLKVIPQEFSNVQSVHLDFSDQDSDLPQRAQLILRETSGAMAEQIVSYRNGWRWTQQFEKTAVEKSRTGTVRKDGIFLLTGGLGGLGLVMADFLCRRSAPTLIFTSRSEFPKEEHWDRWLQSHDKQDTISLKIKKLKRLVTKGAKVHFIQADIADLAKMKKAVIAAEKKFGTVNGIIHAAGVPGEGIMQLKEKEEVEKVMVPKIEGTQNLLNIFGNHELDFMVLCSSIASILGGVGLVDYCSANHYMDSIASTTRLKGGGQIVSVGWDMWGETGMGLKTYVPTELKEWFDNELKNGITSREGQEILNRILNWNGSPNVVISTRDLQRRIDLWIKKEFFRERDSKKAEQDSKPKFSRPDLSISYQRPKSATEKRVAKNWEDLFGINKIGRHDNFFEIGGHSLLATILVNKLRKEFDKNLSIRDVMDHPTVAEIAIIIDNK